MSLHWRAQKYTKWPSGCQFGWSSFLGKTDAKPFEASQLRLPRGYIIAKIASSYHKASTCGYVWTHGPTSRAPKQNNSIGYFKTGEIATGKFWCENNEREHNIQKHACTSTAWLSAMRNGQLPVWWIAIGLSNVSRLFFIFDISMKNRSQAFWGQSVPKLNTRYNL